jgi:hypothetical protein
VLMRRVRADVEAAVVSRTTAGKYRKARPSLMLKGGVDAFGLRLP